MTTIEEISRNYAPRQKRIFIQAWKELFALAKKDNFTDEQANRLSFEILIEQEGILKLI